MHVLRSLAGLRTEPCVPRPARVIPALLVLATVLLALSPTVAGAGEPIAWGWNDSDQCDVPVELRVLGLPDDTHPALADLLDQAVVEQLLVGFDGHSCFLA